MCALGLTDILIAFLSAIFLFVFISYKLSFRYWKVRNVPQSRNAVFPLGTIPNPLTNRYSIGIMSKLVYLQAKTQNYKLDGSFLMYRPTLNLIDPEYIKEILQQASSHFIDRGFYYNEKYDPLSVNLFAIGGEKWRVLRKHMTPAFTTAKLKDMFEDLLLCARQMQETVEKNWKSKFSINVRDMSESFTIDIIGLCAFGLECNSLKNPEAEFKKQGRKIFHFTVWRSFKTALAFVHPNISRWLGIRLFDEKLTQFFIKLVADILEYRKNSSCVRRDFLHLLLGLKNNNGLQIDYLTLKELTAQVFVFFAAGFETSSITLTYCLYELARNFEIQQKLKKEIDIVVAKHGGKITYDAIMNLKYMNQVVEETLRKYPPVPFITRMCVDNYKLSGTEITIDKGIDVFISIIGLHHDPDYYPNPDKFDPDRFSLENGVQIRPFTYLPFGEGPRMCIGMRFGLMQVKTGLAVLLRKYTFNLNKKTKLPLEMERLGFTITPKHNILVDVGKCV